MFIHTPAANRLALALTVACVSIAAPASGQPVNEQLKIVPSDATWHGYFGSSIAMDSAIVAIGAYGAGGNTWTSGSAYLYDFYSGHLIAELIATDGEPEDRFGTSIAIDNHIAAVGAPWDDDHGSKSGSAYLFDASAGEQRIKLSPDDGSPEDRFGQSIDIHSGIVAVGAPWDDINFHNSGSVYLFDASTGAQIAKLYPNDRVANDEFGSSVTIGNGIVAVGAYADDDNGHNSGSVYLFDATTGEQLAKLIASDGEANDHFGWSVAIENDLLAIGALWDDDNGSKSGSVYIFDVLSGEQITKIVPDDAQPFDFFGSSISLSNAILVAGSIGADTDGFESGGAYIFNAITGSQIVKLFPTDGGRGDRFGEAVAIDNGSVTIGVRFHDLIGENDHGAAYVFNVCPADLTGDFVLDPTDISLFLTALSNSDPAADLNSDGLFNFFDVSAFLIAFSDGCP
jgi:FG-GAP repeat